MSGLVPILRDLLARREAATLVTVLATKGSVPREAGTRMIVTSAQSHGTIGGGRLEWDAIEAARKLIESGGDPTTMDVPLGPEIGQCCGGHVSIRLELVDQAVCDEVDQGEQAERANLPLVMLFGAGHVGKALAGALAPLPFRVRWIDARANLFPDPIPHGIDVVVSEAALAEVEAAPTGAAYMVMSHSHALDSMICAAVLQRGDFAHLGLIGSRSKRKQFERAFRDLGIPDEQIARLVCPIGGRLKDKRPPVIAALAAAELIHELADPTATKQPATTKENKTGEAA
ncbi:MAG: xanthine dehydrogenase accessory protein XdhC [Pseudomonadota bacterium]